MVVSPGSDVDALIMPRGRNIACDLRHSKLRFLLTGSSLHQSQTIILGVIPTTPEPEMMW
jgi:hypothetical protein